MIKKFKAKILIVFVLCLMISVPQCNRADAEIYLALCAPLSWQYQNADSAGCFAVSIALDISVNIIKGYSRVHRNIYSVCDNRGDIIGYIVNVLWRND